MYRDTTVAVVIPAYNEEGFVGDVIANIPAYVDRAYVIDDGSTDGTWAEIQEAATAKNEAHNGTFDDLVVPIQHDTNRGVGGAIKTGYLRARDEEIEVTAVLGGDDQMNPVVLTKYIDPIIDGTADYTKGNRFAKADHWEAMPRFRLIGNVILSYLTKIASGYWELMDSQNGYTAISLDALQATDIEGMYEYYGYCNDLLVRLNVADVRVADVPRSAEYAYTEGWKSHIEYSEYIPRVSIMLARGFLRRLQRKYLMTDYKPIAPLYLLGVAVLSTGLLGALYSLLTADEGETGTWTLTAVLGSLTLLGATEADRAENGQLTCQLPLEDDDATAGDAVTDTTANGARAADACTETTAQGNGANDRRTDDDDSMVVDTQ